MTELKLYKFLYSEETANVSEVSWHGDVLRTFMYPHAVAEFADLLGDWYLADGSCEMVLTSGGELYLELNAICRDFDIEVENILARDGK